MRLIVDLQNVQSDLRNKESKLSLQITRAICQSKGSFDVFIVLTSAYPESIEDIRNYFNFLPNSNIRLWHAPEIVLKEGNHGVAQRKIIERLKAAFILSLSPDLVFSPSLPVHFLGVSTADLGVFINGIPTIIGLHGSNNNGRDHLHYLECVKRSSLCVNFERDFCGSHVDGNNYFTCEDEDFDLDELINLFMSLNKTSNSCEILPFRPRVAFLSPLPPIKSGIADYSLDLIKELLTYYEIEVVSDQDISDIWLNTNCTIRTISWFRSNSHKYDRVIYHFGNSPFHTEMHNLIRDIPGIAVLHDLFLGDVQYDRTMKDQIHFSEVMYESHGYNALLCETETREDVLKILSKYPLSYDVFKNSSGVIVHSQNTKNMVSLHYNKDLEADISVIPLLRNKPTLIDRKQIREKLGFSDDEFLIASFGMLGANKSIIELIKSYMNSSLLLKKSKLIFVGENEALDYGKSVSALINESSLEDKILITGWVNSEVYNDYLSCVDAAVQLRTNSRGETSAAVLDCLNYGLPTVVNSNGSMNDLPDNCVLKIPSDFTLNDLKKSLDLISDDSEKRKELSKNSTKYIGTEHSPSYCAQLYYHEIEKYYSPSRQIYDQLIDNISKLVSDYDEPEYLDSLAMAIYQNMPAMRSKCNTLFVDVSAICQDDLKTGIQRVVRAIMLELFKINDIRYRIEPIRMTDEGGKWHFRYARSFTLSTLGINSEWSSDDEVEFIPGDIILGADLTGGMVSEALKCGVYQSIKNSGVKIYSIVYDLLPIEMPEMFLPGTKKAHEDWFRSVVNISDGVVCISKSVATSVDRWVAENKPEKSRFFYSEWFHLGADIDNSLPTEGMPDNAGEILSKISSKPTFVMVGTIEPRKGHDFTLNAFESLWDDGYDINLVIVGKEGWMVDSFVGKLKRHEKIDDRLFWLKGISDEFLDQVYKNSDCLIAASEGEGFGLPLIEAAQNKLPIMARDIPVFREVGGSCATFFDGSSSANLTNRIKEWLIKYEKGDHIKSDDMPWLTWEESTKMLLSKINLN